MLQGRKNTRGIADDLLKQSDILNVLRETDQPLSRLYKPYYDELLPVEWIIL